VNNASRGKHFGSDMKLIELKVVYEGWTKVSVGRFSAEGVPEFRREIEDHGAAAAVLPYDPERKCALLVRQFRAPVFALSGKTDFLEAAAGIIDDDESAEACGRRESLEEMGVRLETLESAGQAMTMPGLSTEVMHMFVAPYRAADRISAGGGIVEEHERIAVVEISLAELSAMAESGALSDMKTLLLLQTLRLRKPELFGP
jgi:nudix-type nucleoside diphosphatase (YffH/AdpP family)